MVGLRVAVAGLVIARSPRGIRISPLVMSLREDLSVHRRSTTDYCYLVLCPETSRRCCHFAPLLLRALVCSFDGASDLLFDALLVGTGHTSQSAVSTTMFSADMA